MCSNCLGHVKDYSVENFKANFINLLNTLKNHNKDDKRNQSIKTALSFLIYFLLLIFSVGEIVYRIRIINSRIKEKRIIKALKNVIYLSGIIILLPFTFVLKILFFPFFIRKIFIKSGKKCR